MTSGVVNFEGDRLRVRFGAPWTMEAYEVFLQTKLLPEHRILYDEDADVYTVDAPARFAAMLGCEAPERSEGWLPLPSWLHDYQAHFLPIALQAKRYAAWWDTGLGKTLFFLEWARQVQHRTAGKVLIIELLPLIPQVMAEAKRFYDDSLPIRILASREDLRAWCVDGEPGIAITNPQKFIAQGGDQGDDPISELTHLAGVVLDESSILKTGGGRIKWSLIKSCRGIEFKLSATATPAPNDPIEYASQASWLECIRHESEVIWTYFIRDQDGEWKIKAHALEAFYRFLSGWSSYLRSPARYGFHDNLASIPEPVYFEHRIQATAGQMECIHQIPDAYGQTSLVDPGQLGIVERIRMGTLASGFLYMHDGPKRTARRIPSLKNEFIAQLVADEVAAGLKVLVWTLYDETAEILGEMINATGSASVEILNGSQPVAERGGIISRFLAPAPAGTECLIAQTALLAFGFNLQPVGSMIFADFNDSFERLYQQIRRALRYGQDKSLRIHMPYVPELQQVVRDNLKSKEAGFMRDVQRMEKLYIQALREQRLAVEVA